MDIHWDGVSRRDWRRLTADADWCALEQSWAYGDAMAARPGTEVRRAVVKDRDGPAAAVQVFARRLGPFITVMQILRGPIWVRHDLSRDRKLAALQCIAATIKRGPREILFWTPELRDPAETDALMRHCGRRRIITGYGSASLDLGAEPDRLRADLHVKWRNALSNAESGPLDVGKIRDARNTRWLLEHYHTLQRNRRFGGPTAAALYHIIDGAPRDDIVMLRATLDGDPVAGALFVRHGAAATYTVGWAGPQGRWHNAGTLLLWRGLLALRGRGVARLDLGGIDTRRAPGIARFKLGTGATPYALAGTYL
jgi:hypothetical protein